ncbi:MAG: hypothetical protein OWQ54_06255 [Sulfolobaceae archaeon]|nr:hypothetical protein [Sulfolobaceae archaeon]
MSEELDFIGVNTMFFASVINSKIKNKRRSIFIERTIGKKLSYNDCENIATFFVVNIHSNQTFKHVYSIILNASGNITLEVFEDDLLEEALEMLPIRDLECLIIRMPYLYQFFIFSIIDYLKRNTSHNAKIEINVKNSVVEMRNKGLRLIWDTHQPLVKIYLQSKRE